MRRERAETKRSHSLTLPDPTVELWHKVGGNSRFTFFKVPVGTSDDHVRREFLRVGGTFMANMAKQGWIADEKTIACLGPYTIPKYDELDMWTFYIACKFIRRTAERVKLDLAQQLDETPLISRPGSEFRSFLGRIAQLSPAILERQASQDRYLAKRAKEEKALREEVRQINVARGMKEG